MKRILFHGTCEQGYQGIKEFGFNPEDAVWTCSDLNCSYFWDLNYFEEKEGMTEENVIRRAFEQATVAAAKNDQRSSNLYVIRIVVDDEEIDVMEDNSCENMYGAVCIRNEDLAKVEMEVFVSDDYYPSLRLFYLSGIVNNRYFDVHLSYVERKAIKEIGCVEELYEFEYIELQ